jgi:hypothetical protein
MTRPQFSAFITKYALTAGIQIKKVEQCVDISDDMVAVIGRSGNECYHGKDWHRTRQEAEIRANEMKRKKLDSIDAQRERIAKLEFGPKA